MRCDWVKILPASQIARLPDCQLGASSGELLVGVVHSTPTYSGESPMCTVVESTVWTDVWYIGAFSMDFKGMQNLAQSVLFYVESSTIDCRIRLYNEMQRCSARPDKSQLESGEVHWNMLIHSSCNELIHWKFQWKVLLHFSHNAFLIVLAQSINLLSKAVRHHFFKLHVGGKQTLRYWTTHFGCCVNVCIEM